MKVTFCPELQQFTNNQSEVEISARTTLQTLLGDLFNDFPSLLINLVSEEQSLANRTTVKLNGDYLVELKDLHRKVSDEDVLAFTTEIPEGQDSGAKILAGAGLIVAGLLSGGAAWAAAAPYMFGFGASLALGGIAEAIIGKPEIPTFSSEGGSSSPSYSFGEIQNTTAVGTPIGVVYGKHRIGGQIISVYADYIGNHAIHESGHICIATLLGLPVFFSRITGKGGAIIDGKLKGGVTRFLSSGNRFLDLVVLLAGFGACATLYSRRGLDLTDPAIIKTVAEGAETDYLMVADVLAGCSDHEADRLRVEAHKLLRHLFDRDDFWFLVETVAGQLMRRGELHHQELAQLAPSHGLTLALGDMAPNFGFGLDFSPGPYLPY